MLAMNHRLVGWLAGWLVHIIGGYRFLKVALRLD